VTSRLPHFLDSRFTDGGEVVTLKKTSVALVRERTTPTERPPLVDEVSANFLRIEGVAWSAQRIPTAVFSDF
jgi:hypothetical protein